SVHASRLCAISCSRVLTGRRQRSGFSGRSPARCLLRSWHPLRYRQRLSVRRDELWARLKRHRVANAVIEARLEITGNALPVATHAALQVNKVVGVADGADALGDRLALLGEAL